MRSPSRPAAHASLHAIVLLWGFTAILGRLISIRAIPLVWYRVVIVTLVLALVVPARGLALRVPARTALRYGAVGALIGIHWMLFYGAIKVAGVSTAVVSLSTGAFFTALIEPAVFRRRVYADELVIGAIVVAGVALLLEVEVHASPLGLVLGVLSALFAAVFGVFNGKLARHEAPERLVLYELGAASVVVTLCFVVVPAQFVAPWQLAASDLGWLAALAVLCTVVPQVWVMYVLRTLSPFTVAVATNLEPVYALVLAAVLMPGEEALGPRFYAGAAVLLALVVLNAARKARR